MSKDNVKDKKCRLFKLEQFMCETLDGKNKDAKVKCYPLPRVFYECPNRPVVEITSLVTIDPQTGELTVPDNLEEKLPQGKLWRDIKQTQK